MNQRIKRALRIFQPHPKAPLGNCAEAIFLAFQGEDTAPPADPKEYRRLAKGKAPGGVCGAYYAGAVILESRRPDLGDEFELTFRAAAGCTGCRTIRRDGKAGCRDCVIAAAKYLDKALPEK